MQDRWRLGPVIVEGLMNALHLGAGQYTRFSNGVSDSSLVIRLALSLCVF
jgi:hypothetical protein